MLANTSFLGFTVYTHLTEIVKNLHSKMKDKRYGLQLRVPPSQQKTRQVKPAIAKPFGFNEEDDDDVESVIARQASKKKSLRDIEEQQKKALEEDPSIFDYDGVYDQMKEKVVKPLVQERQERKPKYILGLMEKAKQRQREQEIVYDRKLAKERSKDDHLYADKDKFVTSAYKKKLAEEAKWKEEERLRELREEKDDVSKKSDISDFYFSLSKNVAFGASNLELPKREKQDQNATTSAIERGELSPRSPGRISSESEERKQTAAPALNDGRSEQELIAEHVPGLSTAVKESPDPKPETESPPTGQTKPQTEPPTADQAKTEHHKRSQDALAAAKERFLARKKQKNNN